MPYCTACTCVLITKREYPKSEGSLNLVLGFLRLMTGISSRITSVTGQVENFESVFLNSPHARSDLSEAGQGAPVKFGDDDQFSQSLCWLMTA